LIQFPKKNIESREKADKIEKDRNCEILTFLENKWIKNRLKSDFQYDNKIKEWEKNVLVIWTFFGVKYNKKTILLCFLFSPFCVPTHSLQLKTSRTGLSIPNVAYGPIFLFQFVKTHVFFSLRSFSYTFKKLDLSFWLFLLQIMAFQCESLFSFLAASCMLLCYQSFTAAEAQTQIQRQSSGLPLQAQVTNTSVKSKPKLTPSTSQLVKKTIMGNQVTEQEWLNSVISQLAPR